MGIRRVDKPNKLIKCYNCQFFDTKKARCRLNLVVGRAYCRSFLSDDICNERNINGREDNK